MLRNFFSENFKPVYSAYMEDFSVSKNLESFLFVFHDINFFKESAWASCPVE